MLEASLTFPLLLVLTFTALDIGRAVNDYLITSRIAYEGARFAASSPGLRANVPCDSALTPCDPGLQNVQNRVLLLATRQGLNSNDLRVRIEVRSLPHLTPQSFGVTIRVEYQFRSLFIGSLAQAIGPLRTTVTGPYLLSPT